MGPVDRVVIDGEVLALRDRGDLQEACALALRSYGPGIMGLLWLRLRDEGAVDECFARFGESLWKGLPGFRGECTFRTWCYQIALNAARKYLRSPYRRRGRRLPTAGMEDLAAQVRDATEPWRKTTVKKQLARLREELGPDDQTLLTLRIDQGMSWRDVALVMSEAGGAAAEAALRKRFQRVKERLRELAEAEGLVRRDREP